MENNKVIRKAYWKFIRKEVKKTAWGESNMKGHILAFLVMLFYALVFGVLYSTNIISVKFFDNVILNIIFELATIIIPFTIFLILLMNSFSYVPAKIYNDQQNDIENLKSRLATKKANIKIKECHYPSYLQATKVGISIQNNDSYDIFPRIRILGDLERIEYFNDGSNKIDIIHLDDDNCVIGSNINVPIEVGNTEKLIFVEVERNENISLLLKNPNLLKSFYSVRLGEYKSGHARWNFTFEIFGKINGEQFKNETYSTFIDAYLRNGEVFVQIDEIKNIN